ncbi:MAG: hypothetical protein K2Q06_11830, partial [Parvularculaceae bacterium]|nr:hypothetical protein [Parvularculaceae bacterium]
DAAAFEDRRTQTNFRLGVSRRIGPAILRAESGLVAERNGFLGASTGGVFGSDVSGRTLYHAASVDAALPQGWRMTARASIGSTSLQGDGVLVGAVGLRSTQFAAGLTRAGILSPHDRLTLSASQPLRVESGALKLRVSDAYDLASRSLVQSDRLVSFGDAPREIDLEARYAIGDVFGGFLETAILRQSNVDAEGGDAVLGMLRGAWRF